VSNIFKSVPPSANQFVSVLIYLVLLVVLTVINRNNEAVPRIWECTIHNFPPLTPSRRNAHALPHFNNSRMAEVVSPAPQRPNTVPSALYSLRAAGLGSQYQIEHFQLPPPAPAPPLPSSPVTSPADHLHRNPSAAGNVQAAVALYPQFLSSAYVSRPPPVPTPQNQPASSSPPPLGDWPRANAPLRIKRKLPPTTGPAEGPAAGGSSLSKPIGPRTRAGAGNSRPPPLDFSSLSARADRERQI
jgi:hypothetical protein